LDYRSDQFSFGSILYEMVTGKRAFQGKTAIDTLGAIINSDPAPIASINPQAPTQLRWIIERCLAKEPRQRYVSTDDLSRDLTTLRDHLSELTSSGTIAATGAARRRFAVPLLGGLVAALALLAAGIVGERWFASRRVSVQAPSLHRLTFRRGNVLHARFAQGGRTVVYGGAWDGAPVEIFTVRTDSTESRPVGLSQADVLGVSPKGELAVLLKKIGLAWGGGGTLARIPLEGGTPREVLEDVRLADWAPNGEDLAVVRRLPNGKVQLEYPIGKILSDEGGFSSIRVSPKGNLVAFFAYAGETDKGTIVTIDTNGKRSVVYKGLTGEDGLAWSPGGDEIVFNGARSADDWAIRAVSLSGRERIVVPSALALHDVAPDGRLLVEKTIMRGGILCEPRGEHRERELGRLDASQVTDISTDGKVVLFVERGPGGFDRVGIFLRTTDGAPAIRLGEGDSMGLSPDGRWVVNLLSGPPHELVMTPTGPGPTKKIPVEGLEPLRASLLPDGKGFLVVGKNNEAVTVSLLGRDGGKPKILRTDGFGADWHLTVSPDGDRFVYLAAGGRLKMVSLSGGEVTTIPGAPLDSNEHPIQWSADGRYLYLWRAGEVPARVDRLELSTGRRESWKQLQPQDPVGITDIGPVVVAPDGHSFAYSYMRILASDLFVVDGVN
jgi:hypothetical protein